MTLAPWQRHERDFASMVPGGQAVLASGRLVERMDVQTDRSMGYWRFLYSLKSTSNRTLRFDRAWWQEVCDAVASRSVEMRPAMGLRFYGADGNRVLADLVVCGLDDWVELLSCVVGRGSDGDSS